MSSIQLDNDRRRTLLTRVQKHMSSWQSIFMTSEYDNPSVAKGRYLASKEFFDWLSNGGKLEDAESYLNERIKYYNSEAEKIHSYEANVVWNSKIQNGEETEEAVLSRLDKLGLKHLWLSGFYASPEELLATKPLAVQYSSMKVGFSHLLRFVRDVYTNNR